MSDLSILCVTTGKERAKPFIDHFREVANEMQAELVVLTDGVDIKSDGFIESCLTEAIGRTTRPYVLRLDDDEQCSASMRDWLKQGCYRERSNWHFPRVHLWGNPWTVLLEEGYFPDIQTRLSMRQYAPRPSELHAPSRFPGWIAPVCLEHWTFLVKPYEERLELGGQYLALMNGDVSQRGTIEDQKKGDVMFGAWGGQTIELTDNGHAVKWTGTEVWRGSLTGSRR